MTGFRWIQVGGPTFVNLVQEGHFVSFTPKVPGPYRFVLVVASAGQISEPDPVDVLVGILPAPSPGNPASSGAFLPGSGAAVSSVSPPMTTEELARASLAAVPGSSSEAAPIAEGFEATAGRVDLFNEYAELLSEMSRRITANLPADPNRRAALDQRLFNPLSSRLIEQLREEGLDLSRPEGTNQAFTPAQRKRLAGQLRAMAAGLRPPEPKP